MTIREAIAKVALFESLSSSEMTAVMHEIMDGVATPSQVASFVTALRMKGETVDEIVGAVTVMREKCVRIRPAHPVVLDTCGTGGDSANTVNISTISAVVAAGAGVMVAKHGNRAVSSRCGSADVLKELGVNIECPPDIVERCINEIGIGFIFAPLFHPAMKHAIGPRREIGIRTIFNILGPLTNPAGARYQLLGVYDSKLTGILAEVLRRFDSERAIVVNGDGLDEITITGRTEISELKNGKVNSYSVSPVDFGIKEQSLSALAGGDPAYNARIMLDTLRGEPGPIKDAVILNAGSALYVAGAAGDIKQGMEQAEGSIRSGRALLKLNQMVQLTNKK